eukprot:SAG22_NODE_495_length_9802_cov_111.077605_6_plen_87_part_00
MLRAVVQTSRHLYIFDNTADFVNSFENVPKETGIAGFLELSRYQVGHRRADDMLVIPVPLTHIKVGAQTAALVCVFCNAGFGVLGA